MKHLYCIVPAVVFLNACGPSTPPPMYQAPAIVQQTPAPVIIQQDSGLGSALLGAAAGAAVTAAVLNNRQPAAPQTYLPPQNITNVTKNVTVINKTVNVSSPAAITTPLPQTPLKSSYAIANTVMPTTGVTKFQTPTIPPTPVISKQPIKATIPKPMVIRLSAPKK